MTAGIGRLALGFAQLLALWQLVAWLRLVPEAYFPPPFALLESIADLTRRGELWPAIAVTFARACIGLAASIAAGLALAMLAARYRMLGRALTPVADLLRSLPPAAITPISIFFLGLGWKLYAFILIFACIWPIFLNAHAALDAVANQQLATARVYGYEGWTRMLRVQLPAALPDTFIGIRLAAAVALIAEIAAEMLAGRDGLGHLMSDAAFSLRIPDTFVGLVAAIILGVAMNLIVVASRHLLVGWHATMTITNRGA